MHVRISIVTGASDVDKAVGLVRDEVVDQLRGQKGFRGLSASGDRATGTLNVLTLWDSEADREASESTADKARNAVTVAIGGEVRVERYEQTVWEMASGARMDGAKLHIRSIQMDPARIDESLEFFRHTVAPGILSEPGCLGVRQLIDRRTGEGRVGTLWADEASLQAALAKTAQRREVANEHGVEFGDERILETFFAVQQ